MRIRLIVSSILSLIVFYTLLNFMVERLDSHFYYYQLGVRHELMRALLESTLYISLVLCPELVTVKKLFKRVRAVALCFVLITVSVALLLLVLLAVYLNAFPGIDVKVCGLSYDSSFLVYSFSVVFIASRFLLLSVEGNQRAFS